MLTPPKETPWGPWHQIREIIPGVWRVATASHGGYWLTPVRLAEMPAVLRQGPQDGKEKPFSLDDVRAGWFEEDVEAVRVVVAFCHGGNVGAFPGDNPGGKARAKLEKDFPQTHAALKAAGWFDQHAPKRSGVPDIVPTGTT